MARMFSLLERSSLALVACACACSSTASSPPAAAGQPPNMMGVGGGAGVASGGAGGVVSSAGSPGTTAGTAGLEVPPRHVVSPCPAAGTGTGTWENVTPEGLNLAADFKTPAGDNFGAHAFVIDPQDTATVYLGSSGQGIFKSTDCGATWIHVSHGDVDQGRNGSMVIDPIDSQVLYTDGRYGPVGVFKSTNGGVDWKQILPPDIASAFIFGGMVEWIAMDPTDHRHLTVTPHFNCEGAHAPNCMLETMDGGDTWRVIDNVPAAGELSGQVMLDRNTWLVALPFGGLWRTADGGATWAHVYDGGAGPYIYTAADGSYYMPGNLAGVIHSTDGINWTPIPSANQSGALAATKTALFSDIGLNDSMYFSAPIDNPTQWSGLDKVPVPQGNGGWMLHGDADHNIVYSSNFKGGFWRYVQK